MNCLTRWCCWIDQKSAGATAVSSVEYLAAAALVYNLQIVGEHVYEITNHALLVHNANWD